MIIPVKAGVAQNHNKLFRLYAKIRSHFANPQMKDYRKVPVIINNFNRLEYLRQLITWLEKAGMKNIFIIDNLSTYPPLINYYKTSPYVIFRLDKNVGHTAIWNSHIYMLFQNRPYVYTDPDVVPIKECPLNAVEHFYQILQRNPDVGKVGFGLKIDDLPDYYPPKQKVIKWEKQFWQQQVEDEVYTSRIDTTFALYRANCKGDAGLLKALRTGGVYVARHLPWYLDPDNLSPEERYFVESTNNISSWYEELKGGDTNY